MYETNHRKVIAGADVIVESLMYPVAAATMHPTSNPTIILAFFRNGLPNNSVKIIAMNERNPRPMNSGLPLKEMLSVNHVSEQILDEPRKWAWGIDGRAELEDTGRGPFITVVASTAETPTLVRGT